MNAPHDPSPRVRRLFYVRHRKPEKPADPKPCCGQWHEGPLDFAAVYERAGGVWRGMGECRACGSTIHRSQIRRAS